MIYFVLFKIQILKRFTVTYFLVFITMIIHGQQDSTKLVKYDYSFYFNEGIYLDFKSFRNNSPLSLQSIIYPQADDGLFFERLDTAEFLIFNDKYGINITVDRDKIWGYSKNGKPYILWADKFNLIPFVGSVCHFITTITVNYTTYHDPFYDPYYYPSSRTYQTEELRQFLIDTETGNIILYSIQNAETILKRDTELYEGFSKLGKRKKNKQLFYYIKQYNEKHDYLIPE